MKKLLSLAVILALSLSAASIVLAATSPGQQGYEGQPGNQGGNTGPTGNPPQGNPGGSGNTGYEGQPGNQSNGGK